jgi:SAM-dependent methyltransferase
LGTDADWEEWGATDPYFGVLSTDEYHAENLSEESREKFFLSGKTYIDQVLDEIRTHLDSDYRPARSLDFGCGVGRLVIPLCGVSDSVVGVDVSDNMLAEAASNCRERNIENVSFVKSNTGMTGLDGAFNLIHSCLVLQHIPAPRGMQLVSSLLDHLEPGGVVAIQFYYRCDAPKLVRSLVKLRYRLPAANYARNLMRGRPVREPAMQLHTYDMETMIDIAYAAGVNSIYLDLFRYGEFQSVTLYGQKAGLPEKTAVHG